MLQFCFLFYCTAEWNEDLLNEIKGQLQLMLKSFDSVHIVCYPIVKRGNNFPRYLPLSDGRLVEYDFDELLFEHTSAFQNIKIVQSLSFGRTLLLDDVLNLAESDAIYTNTLLRKDCGDHYKDKEVLVLGGGDGAALNALLQDSPKHVTMVEIDCEVMNACRQYMPSVCGSVLDQWKGSNYEIIVDDCVPQLQQFVESGRKFDAIFNDLTDVPVGATTLDDQPKVWSFVRSVMSQCIRCLRPGGVCVAHATGSGAKSSLLKYEQMLQQQMPATVDISKRQVWVPSFLEFWVFFDVRLQSVHHSDVESDVAMVNK